MLGVVPPDAEDGADGEGAGGGGGLDGDAAVLADEGELVHTGDLWPDTAHRSQLRRTPVSWHPIRALSMTRRDLAHPDTGVTFASRMRDPI